MKENTRKKIISVAHNIFARQGIIKTTMGDIAKACGIGRRTLYTYFSTREDLYSTVVKKEVDAIMKRLYSIVKSDAPPEKKIVILLATHMKAVEDLISRNRILKLDFITRHERIEELRKDLDKREKKYIASILAEGMDTGVFSIEDSNKTATIAHTTLKGLEVEFISDNFGKECFETLKLCQSIFLKGISSDNIDS
jgi:AcrR family transcriptional regulator